MQVVYDTISRVESVIDGVVHRNGLPPSAVSVALLDLEMKQIIRHVSGKLIVENR